MRRGKDHRLNIVLGKLDTIPGWVQRTPDPEDGWDPRRSAHGYRQATRDLTHPDTRLVEYSTWVHVVAEQEDLTPAAVNAGLPADRLYYGPFNAAETLVDRGLASLTEAETHALAEDMAKAGVAAVSAAEIRETIAGNDVTLYPNRWMRVPDHVFAQYGRLEDRRPFPGVA